MVLQSFNSTAGSNVAAKQHSKLSILVPAVALLTILLNPVYALRLPPVGIGLPQLGVNTPAITDSESKDQQQSILKKEKADSYLLPNQFVDNRRRYSCAYDYDPHTFSMREARISMPLMALFSSFLSSSAPAAADTLIPSSSFDLSLKAFFPTALTSKETADRIVRVLKERGYVEANTCFGASICSDEINRTSNTDFCLFTALKEEYGHEGAFELGGLAGIPFVGKSGLGAYAHHVPDKDTQAGKLLILYGPHVGISEAGDVGKIRRVGRAKLSGSCGAGIGAYQAIARSAKQGVSRDYDFSEEYIIQELQKRFSKDPSALDRKAPVDPIVYTTYQVYCMSRDLLYSSVASSGTLDECDEIAMVGGVIINQYGDTDYFQPLSFQAVRKVENKNLYEITDLYGKTFGRKPLLTSIAGNEESVQDVMTEILL